MKIIDYTLKSGVVLTIGLAFGGAVGRVTAPKPKSIPPIVLQEQVAIPPVTMDLIPEAHAALPPGPEHKIFMSKVGVLCISTWNAIDPASIKTATFDLYTQLPLTHLDKNMRPAWATILISTVREDGTVDRTTYALYP